MGANPTTDVLIEGNLDPDTDKKGERHVTTEAEIGVVCLQPRNTTDH